MATTTNYGWDTPDDTDLVKDGALAIRDLGQDVDTQLFEALGGDYPGLRLIKKQTIGSAVPSVSVSDAFSATYENYKIVVSSGAASAASNELRLSLNGITTGYYSVLTYQAFGSTTVIGAQTSNTAAWSWTGAGTTASLDFSCELAAPNLAKPKRCVGFYNEMGIASTSGTMRGYNASTAVATGFTITASTGTMSGGTIYVYGYGTS